MEEQRAHHHGLEIRGTSGRRELPGQLAARPPYRHVSQRTSRAVGESSAINSNTLKIFMYRAADDPAMLEEKGSTEYLADEIGRRIYLFV